jgi:hypothetical protein
MAWQLLQPSINLGLEEDKFWDMTLAEVDRFITGATWRMKTKAQYDYALASVIGCYSARVVSEKVEIPSIEEVYPHLFDKVVEEKPQEDLTTKSVNNFLAAAMKINAAQRAKSESGGEHNE